MKKFKFEMQRPAFNIGEEVWYFDEYGIITGIRYNVRKHTYRYDVTIKHWKTLNLIAQTDKEETNIDKLQGETIWA